MGGFRVIPEGLPKVRQTDDSVSNDGGFFSAIDVGFFSEQLIQMASELPPP